MKKKDYFIISAIIQIIASISAILNAKKIGESLAEVMNTFFSDSDVFSKSGTAYIIAIALVCIILNIIIIYYASKDSLLRNKGKIIACSAISIFTSLYLITELLAIVNIIVMASWKRVKPEDFPPEKEKMPVLKKETIDIAKIIKAIILLVIYFSQFAWSKMVPENGNAKIILGIIFYLLMITLSIVFFKDLLKSNIKAFKKHFKAYYQNLLPLVGKYYLIYLLVAIAAAILSNQINSVNQQKLMELPMWYLMPLAVIYAPIVEETIFRGCLRRLIKNDKIFIVVSALAFGLIHTISSESTIYNAIIMAFPYMAMGGFLAYLYVKTNNILCNMSFHCFHNTLATILSFLIRL